MRDEMKILVYDIETSPNTCYTWGLWRQDIYLNQVKEFGSTLCWAAKWYGEKEMMFSSIHRDGKEKMLHQIYRLIDEADVVIHYNGTKFDMPILNQEFLSLSLAPPSPVIQIDLLKVVRKRFRFPSNKMDYVAKYLKLGWKLEHKGMQLWLDCMDGDKLAWKVMEEYNKKDVILTEKIYKHLLPWIPNHPNYGLFQQGQDDRPVCPNCGSNSVQKRGLSYTSTLTYQRYRCNGCGTWSKNRYTNSGRDNRKNVLKGI